MKKIIPEAIFHEISLRVGLLIIVAVLVFSLAGILVTPWNPLESRGDILQPPSSNHLLGTDDLGRDILALLSRGVLTSLFIGLVAAATTTLIGLLIGLVAALYGGVLDAIIMRIVDFLLATPSLVLAMILVAILKPSIWNIVLVLAVTSWPGVSRVVRAHILQILSSGYIDAAKSLGAGLKHIAIKHVVPASLPIILANMVTSVRGAILLEAGLSFLGLGDPSTISLGTILFYARRTAALASGAWWTFVPAGLLITVIVYSLTMISLGVERLLSRERVYRY